jgi:hypothetical protein
MTQRNRNLRLLWVPPIDLVHSIFPLCGQALAYTTRIQNISFILVLALPLARRWTQTKCWPPYRCFKTMPVHIEVSFLYYGIYFYTYFNFTDTSLVYSYPNNFLEKLVPC